MEKLFSSANNRSCESEPGENGLDHSKVSVHGSSFRWSIASQL